MTVSKSDFKVQSIEGWFKTFIWYECEESSGITTKDRITIKDIEIKEGDAILVVRQNGFKIPCIAKSDVAKGIEYSQVISYDDCEDGSSGTTTINNVIWVGSGYI